MSADVTRIAELTDELYKELVKQNHWDNLRTVGHFSKASTVDALEEKEKEYNRVRIAFRDLNYFYYQAVKRFQKLDTIHQCQCDGCSKQRDKFNNLLKSKEEHDIRDNIKEIEAGL
jgi:hypothetical protein